MQIKVAKQDLETTRKLVASSLASSGDGLEPHNVFRVGDGKVEIYTNKGRLVGSSPLKCEFIGEEGDAFTIEGSRLTKWLSVVSDSALTFEFDGGVVTAIAPLGSVTFQSLDPSRFPYWDKMLKEAKLTAKIKAEKLANVLDFIKEFVWDEDTKGPHFCVTEAREGVFWASDQSAVGYARVDDLPPECTLRAFHEDIPAFVKHLRLLGDDEVEILETERMIFLRRADGTIFGCSRYNVAFPAMGNLSPDMPDDVWWTFSKEELVRAIKFMAAAVTKGDFRLRIPPPGDTFCVQMTSAAGKQMSIQIPMSDYGVAEGASFPEDGFDISYPFILKVLEHQDKEDIRLGLKVGTGGRGWIRFDQEDDGVCFLSVLTWLV